MSYRRTPRVELPRRPRTRRLAIGVTWLKRSRGSRNRPRSTAWPTPGGRYRHRGRGVRTMAIIGGAIAGLGLGGLTGSTIVSLGIGGIIEPILIAGLGFGLGAGCCWPRRTATRTLDAVRSALARPVSPGRPTGPRMSRLAGRQGRCGSRADRRLSLDRRFLNAEVRSDLGCLMCAHTRRQFCGRYHSEVRSDFRGILWRDAVGGEDVRYGPGVTNRDDFDTYYATTSIQVHSGVVPSLRRAGDLSIAESDVEGTGVEVVLQFHGHSAVTRPAP